jgi:diguanylate cyclase (GGDEF)-like protein
MNRAQNNEVREHDGVNPTLSYSKAPDGLAGGRARLATTPNRRRNRARDAMPHSILARLPLAVAAIDKDARLLFWNEHAARLFRAPPSMAESTPGLAAILTGASALTQSQRDRVVAFARAHTGAGGCAEDNDRLLLSLGREWRIAIQIHGLDAGRWMLVFDDGRLTAPSGPAASGPGAAWLDALSGVSNRRHFNHMLWAAMDDVRIGPSHAVLLIDLDRFAAVNEAFGNEAGDSLLCLAAARLRREIRDVDLLARLGGDEFAVLMPNGESAEALAARAIAVLRQPFAVQGQRITISASVGVAHFPEPGVRSDDLLRQAELALYEAKSAGGCTWRCFDAARADELQTRRKLATELQRTLALGQFSPEYQARADVASN